MVDAEPDAEPAYTAIADEIDAIAAKRESAQREMERRIVAQMLTCLDDLSEQPSAAPLPDGAPPLNKHVVVIGAPAHSALRQTLIRPSWDLQY